MGCWEAEPLSGIFREFARSMVTQFLLRPKKRNKFRGEKMWTGGNLQLTYIHPQLTTVALFHHICITFTHVVDLQIA